VNLPAETGRTVAGILSGSWRQQPPLPGVSSATLSNILPILLRSASAGLAWWKVRESDRYTAKAVQALQDAYRQYSLNAAVHERNITSAFRCLRSRGIEPILAKGWAVARMYPRPGMRPYGDMDLCVPPEAMSVAVAALVNAGIPLLEVDFHERFRELESSYDALYLRSRLIRLGKTSIRVLAPEDHFRLLCIHMLYHGAWKPVWLCDIAVFLENLPSNFNWNHCLDGDRRRTEWVVCAILLAQKVLGASLPKSFPAGFERPLPDWFVHALFQQWGQFGHYMQGDGVPELFKDGRGLLKILRQRWPNALQATVRTGAPINSWPRLPFQIADSVKRTSKFLIRRRAKLHS
jgi:hypothetical protein